MIQFVSALEDITYLPSRMYSAHHYSGIGTSSYLQTSYSLDVGTLFLRIAGLLTLAWICWNCGTWVANLLLPAASKTRTRELNQSGGDGLASPE